MSSIPKPYLYAEELAELVPWSVEAIRKKVQRGELQQGIHYFQDRHRARLIFKWESIVALIEKGPVTQATRHLADNHNRRRVLDVEAATAALQRMLREDVTSEEESSPAIRRRGRRK